MILKNKAGKESLRKFKTTTLENPDPREGDKGIIVFLEPRDVKGTSLLTHSKIEPEDDSQWIFLPAIKRVNVFLHQIELVSLCRLNFPMKIWVQRRSWITNTYGY